jgi:hypothetical protein
LVFADQDQRAKTPIDRKAQPDQFGRVLVNLAGDNLSHLTSTTFFVDDGMTGLRSSRTAVEKTAG